MNCPHCGASFGEGYSQCPVCKRTVTDSGPRAADPSAVVSHSPLPWSACFPTGPTNQRIFPHIHIGPKQVADQKSVDAGWYREVGQCRDHGYVTINTSGSLEACDADAELIVRAVNSHYQLVEALEASLAFMNSFEGRVSLEVWRDLYDPLTGARAALQTAKGVA